MHAVITTGGQQFLVRKGEVLQVDLLKNSDKKLEFEPLMIIDGDKTLVGTPVVSGAKVTAELLDEVKGDKLKILKFKPKKRIKRQTGHRQRYQQIKITAISAPAK